MEKRSNSDLAWFNQYEKETESKWFDKIESQVNKFAATTSSFKFNPK